MKKLLIGLTLLTSMTSFASESYQEVTLKEKGDVVTKYVVEYKLPKEMKCIDNLEYGISMNGGDLSASKELLLNVQTIDGAIDKGTIRVKKTVHDKSPIGAGFDPDVVNAVAFVTAPLWIIPVGISIAINDISTAKKLKALLKEGKESLNLPNCSK